MSLFPSQVSVRPCAYCPFHQLFRPTKSSSKNKIKTKQSIPCKVDTCNYNLCVDSQKHLKIKLLKNSYKEFSLYKFGKIDKDNYRKPINEIIKNIEKDLQLMEFTLKDFQENNSEIRNFLIKI